MLNKNPSLKAQVYVAGILFLFCFSVFTVLISINNTAQKSLQPSPAPLLGTIDPPYYIQTNITKVGQGNNYNYYENAWGVKTHRNLNQNSRITWETPGSWTGQFLSVSLTDLKKVLSGPLYPAIATCTLTGGLAQTSWTNSRTLNGLMYNITWTGIGGFIITYEFDTEVVGSSVSHIYIATYGFWTHLTQAVSYYIHNFTSGGNVYLAQMPQDTIGWLNTSITSGLSDYVSSSGVIQIQFRASGALTPGSNHLDFVGIEVTAAHEWISPEDADLSLNDGLSDYSITGNLGSGSVSIAGSWTENPKYFYFKNFGINIIFNATSSFWAYQNKIGSVTSTYYLNLSQSSPATHQWRLRFTQDAYPSGNFTSLNFSVSLMPYDWLLVNATNPGGSLRTLDEQSAGVGKRLVADTGDISAGGGTWNIYYKSPNYISSVQLWNKTVLLPPNPQLKVWDKLDIQVNFSRRIISGRVNLTVSFENKVNKSDDQSGISGVMTNFNWQINSTANKNGTYLITISFFNQTEIGIYSCFINVYFPTAISLLTPEPGSLEFQKGDTLNVTAFFENLFYPGNYYNEKGIVNANVRWIMSNSSYSESGNLVPRSGGYYNSTLNTSSLEVVDGSYNLTITANKVGYENQSHFITLRCFEILHPTKAAIIISSASKNLKLISGMNYSCWVYPNQSLTIQFNYTDIFKSPFLIDYGLSSSFLYNSIGTLLPGYSSVGIRSSPYLHKINISNLNLPLGQYTLLINVSKKHFMNSTIWVNYTISPLASTIKVSKLYGTQNITVPYIEWENLSLAFKVEYRTTKYYQFSSWNTPINWGLVRYFMVLYGRSISNPANILKTGIINVNGTGIFEMRNFPLSNASGAFLPGIYQIYIICNATECQARNFNFNVTIREKLNTSLTISKYPEKFSVDQRISLEAILTTSGAPQSELNQKIVYFNITAHFKSENITIFQISDAVNQYGKAELNFYLGNYILEDLDDISSLEISGYFKGFNANYPTSSFHPSSCSKVTSNVSTPFDISFIIYIILGVVGGIATVFVVQRKIIAPKQLKQTNIITYLFKSFKDVVSLQNLFVILKSTGSCLLCKTYSPEGIPESMETVLCKVIANYGKGDRRHDAFCDLIRFENNKLLLDDGDFVRVAVTIGATPSEQLIRSLVRFVQYFELQNYSLLKNATGPVAGLQGVDELLDIQFGASLIAPYTLTRAKKLSGFEETVHIMAANLIGEHDYFFLSQLYARAKGETLVDEVMIFKTIQDLVDKQVIVLYDATKKKEGAPKLAILDFDRLKANIVSTKNKALKAVTAKRFEDAVDLYREAASLAASIGDFEVKDQFLKKADECSANIIPLETGPEQYPEEISETLPKEVSETVPEEIPEPSPEQLTERIPLPKKVERPPPPPSKPIQPSYLEDVRKKSKDLLEVEEASTPEPSFAESLLEDTDELTPFERELARHDELSMKAAYLMAEEPPPPPPEKTIPIPEPAPPTSKGSVIEDAFEILEQTKSVKEEVLEKRPPIEELKPPLKKERPPVKERFKPPVKEELPIVREEVSLAREEIPLVREEIPPAKEEKPKVPVSAKELKEINNSLSDSAKVMQDSTKKLTELNNLAQKLSIQKDRIKEEAKQTHDSIMEKVKSHIQHLLVPRKDIKEEIEITKTDIPDIIKEIDSVDSEVIKIKKQISESTKDCKKLREGLEQANSKMTTAEKYISEIPSEETSQEKKQLASFTKSYSEAIGTLDTIQKQVSSLNQEIVTLMIEDIEKMMAQEQNLEKILNETYQKLKDTNKVQEAFLKENKKLNEDLEALDRVISLGETILSDSLIQKQPLLSTIERFETGFQSKIQSMRLTINDRSKELGLVFSDLQVLKNGIDRINQDIRLFQDRIEKNTHDLGKFTELVSKSDQRKKNIFTVIEKTTKFIFPNIILKQRAFLTDFDEKIQNLSRKHSELTQSLNAEKIFISQTLSAKVNTLTNILQETESKASSAQRSSPSGSSRFLPEPDSLLRTEPEEKEATLFPELEAEEKEREKAVAPPPEEDATLTDKKLGLKQHCPYCKHIIPDNLMNLLRKGFEPDCPNCGEKITPSKIQTD